MRRSPFVQRQMAKGKRFDKPRMETFTMSLANPRLTNFNDPLMSRDRRKTSYQAPNIEVIKSAS